MSTPNPFASSAFKQTNLTKSFNEMAYMPMQLGASGLFSDVNSIPTSSAWIERGIDTVELLSVRPRGAVAQQTDGMKRKGNYFAVPHVPASATILAESIQDVRAFGSESIMSTMTDEINKRNMLMRNNIEYTLEYHRMLALQGLMMTADNASLSLYTEFGMTEDSVNMILGTDTTKLRVKIADIINHVEAGLAGLPYKAIQVYCSDGFFTSLVTHPIFEKAYTSWQASPVLAADPFAPFVYGGLQWVRYRGTSDIKITDNEARAVPILANGSIFHTAIAPADTMAAVNTLGQPFYVTSELLDHDKGVELTAQTNQLIVNLKPDACVKITAS